MNTLEPVMNDSNRGYSGSKLLPECPGLALFRTFSRSTILVLLVIFSQGLSKSVVAETLLGNASGGGNLQGPLGFGVAAGAGSLAIGQASSATAPGSVALGGNNSAIVPNSVAVGVSNRALSDNSVAFGVNNLTILSAARSAAVGYLNEAAGVQSSALGVGNSAFGLNSTAVGSFAQTLGNNAFAGGSGAISTTNGTALGNAANAGVNGTALGSAANAVGNGVAVGDGASAAANAAAIGAGSVASAGTVSVGSAGAERRITNVAAGTALTDGVNVSQLQGAVTQVSANSAQILADANNYTNAQVASANNYTNVQVASAEGRSRVYTDARVNNLNHQLVGYRNNSYGGIAAVSAMAVTMREPLPGKMTLNVGVGTFAGQTAVAGTAVYKSRGSRMRLAAAVSQPLSFGVGPVAAIGLGWEFF